MSDTQTDTGQFGATCEVFQPSYWHHMVVEIIESPTDDALEHLGQCQACQKLVDGLLKESFDSLLGRSAAAIASAERTALLEETVDQRRLIDRIRNRLLEELEGVPEGPDPLPQKIGRYTVLRKLGHGAMSQVFQCHDEVLNRQVAVKLFPEASYDAHRRHRTNREARIQAGISHPNIVRLYEVNTDSQTPYLVMELMRGGSLKDLKQSGPVPPLAAAAYLESIARAVHHAHEKGVLHRDLKPSNILIEQATTPENPFPADLILKVADFGLAKALGATSDLTATNCLVGTPAYMSPEQSVGGSATLGPASDIYALGAIFYDLLVGRAPIMADDVRMTLVMIRETPPISPRLLQPHLPRDLETICLKCLEKTPSRRYESAQALADDLRRFLDHQPIKARPVSKLAKAWLWSKRNRWQALGYGLALFSLMLALIVGTYFGTAYSRANQEKNETVSKAKGLALDALTHRSEIDQARGRVEMAYYQAIRQTHRQFNQLLDRTAPGPARSLIEQTARESRASAIQQLKMLQSRVEDDFNRPEANLQIMAFLGTLLAEDGQQAEAELWNQRVIQAALNYPAGSKADTPVVVEIYQAALSEHAALHTGPTGPANNRLENLKKLYQAWPLARTQGDASESVKPLRQKLAQALGLPAE